MSLTPGSRLGSYVIEAHIGAGGMGEVYRALDTRLERYVALKVLAPSLAADPARLERFTREARAPSAIRRSSRSTRSKSRPACPSSRWNCSTDRRCRR